MNQLRESKNNTSDQILNLDKAWTELLDMVGQGARESDERGQQQIKWLHPNRLVLLGRWQVQARFAEEPGKYFIYFERFGAEMGDVNFELSPNAGQPKRIVVTMLLELTNGEAFWRLSDGQTLKSSELARRIVDCIQRFHDEYGLSIINPGY